MANQGSSPCRGGHGKVFKQLTIFLGQTVDWVCNRCGRAVVSVPVEEKEKVMPTVITKEQLKRIMLNVKDAGLDAHVEGINAALVEFDILTVLHVAAYLGQVALESGELKYMEEIADGSAYEGRKDLGNVNPGDGKRYKGRGPIQLSGRANYRAAGLALGLPLEENPEMVATPAVGHRVSAWFWKANGLNEKADSLDYKLVTSTVNGRATIGPPCHYERRLEYYARALAVFSGAMRLA